MVLDRRWYERREFEFKRTEDVLGGAESWKNVDTTEGMYRCARLAVLIHSLCLVWADSRVFSSTMS